MIKKVLNLLLPNERKRLYLLSTVMVISAITEVAGIASILPFLSLITKPDVIQTNQYLKWAYTFFGFQSPDRFLIFTGIVVLVIMVVSKSLVFLTHWGLARFSWMRVHSISNRLLTNYLYQPYRFYLNKNTTILGKNIVSEVQTVVKGVMAPMLEVMARGVVAIFIFAMLVAVEPLLALAVMGLLGGAYLFSYRLLKKKLSIRGKTRYRVNAERFNALNVAFNDIKQLKVMGYEDYFIKRYAKPSFKFAATNATTQILGQIPGHITEVIAFGGIIIIVLYLLATGGGLEELLPIIGLYAFATYRLQPSIQSIFTGIADIRFNAQALGILYDDLYESTKLAVKPKKQKIEPMAFNKEILLDNITFYYPGTQNPVIENLKIKIGINTSIAFVGSTGAGKTTIANIILGLLRPDSGSIVIDGAEVTDKNLQSWQRNLGYIPQDIYLMNDTVVKNITFGIPNNLINKDAVIKAAQIANIHDFIMQELPEQYKTVIGEKGIRLSGGQRQRIGIARAIYHDPSVLVLDEATSALDGATELEVFNAIENLAKTKTLIIIAHRLTTVQDCDIIYVIENGKIAGAGKYDELLKSNKAFRKIAKEPG